MRKAILHIYTTHNNVLMTATDLTGAETICKVSGGMVTKGGSDSGGQFASTRAAERMAEMLAEKGALEYRHCEAVPDYWAEIPEDKCPTGRVLVPKGARDTMSDGGAVAVEAEPSLPTFTDHRGSRLTLSLL